jgi:dienelactone hydrolase
MDTPGNECAARLVAIGGKRLEGEVIQPWQAKGLVIFAHGSGSSRFSPRNRQVARQLAARGLGTLLFDLLTAEEGGDRQYVFDISLLGDRMMEAVHFARSDPELLQLSIGLFGASTGAAAALLAAARIPDKITAVVSRGGRPDLAGAALTDVRAATLLIVGGADHGVIELNQKAYDLLACKKRLAIVPGATHLFEEPGALDTVVELASQWFSEHFKVAQT